MINVDADIVNSSVYTMENIVMGDKGMILGGEIYAVQGIRTGGIGKKAGRATSIHCGVDFTALQEKERKNYALRIINAKLAKVNELLEKETQAAEGNMTPAEKDIKLQKIAKLTESAKTLAAEQQKTQAAITELLGRLNMADGAVIDVLNEVAPGTIIEICQIALFVTEPLKHVRIRLDRAQGKVVSEPLGG